MTRSVISASPNSSIHECAKKMAKERLDSLPILKDKKLIGLISARDILWAITKKPSQDLKKLKAIKIATKKVAVIKPSADITLALKKMQGLNFKRLPVLSRGETIGVVTLKDILRIEPTLYSEINSLTDIREENRKLQETEKEWPQEGLCDNCGAFSELLKIYDKILCPDCREELY